LNIKVFLFLSAVIASQLIGCAGNVQMGDPAQSTELKKFAAKAEVGLVYVCRNSSILGTAIHPSVFIDGYVRGALARNTYTYTELKPGKHKIISKTDEHDSAIDFSIEAGEQKFFQSWISMGVFSGWGIIDEMKTDEGKDCVTKADLVVKPKP